MSLRFAGRTALITGAGRGLGKAIALEFASGGANVCINDVDGDAAERAASEVEGLGVRALALPGNVSQVDSVDAMVEAALNKFGNLDILVNNAGIVRDNLLLRLKKEDWDAVLAVNLTGAFLCSKAVLPPMLKQRYGRIVSISSVIGFMGNAGQANYAASKAGLAGFTRALARELASRGITVNAVAPGFIDTEMTRAMPEKAREGIMQLIPAQRLGTPEDVAHCVKFLASEEASYITGQVIHVNGGMWM